MNYTYIIVSFQQPNFLFQQEDLPSKMPSLFSSAYTPIAAAGTPAQIRHVSRLLATQLHLAGLGPGALLQSETQVYLKIFHLLPLIIQLVYLIYFDILFGLMRINKY